MAAGRWISPFALLALWQLAATGVLEPDTLESAATIVATGWDLIETGELPDALLVSLRRAMAGLLDLLGPQALARIEAVPVMLAAAPEESHARLHA